MIVSFEAYEPHTNDLDAVSIQGCPDVEVEGGIDDGGFDVTFVDRQVAFGLVDRGADNLIALTITEPVDVSWTVTEGEEYDGALLQRVLDDTTVQAFLDDNDWYPSTVDPGQITSARGIEHGDVTPVVLSVIESDTVAAVVAYVREREDDVGNVIDVRYVERFVETPMHERAAAIEPADETVLEEVPSVPLEQRPLETADDGEPQLDEPPESFEAANWSIEWEYPEHHGVEITASYMGTPVFENISSPVTFVGYGIGERGDESTLEWFFPDNSPVFGGEMLRWDVHSSDFGGPEPLGLLEYPERDGLPDGFGLTSQYRTGSVDPASRDHHSGQRFGQTNHEITYIFWEDGTVIPVWKRHGPGFVTEYEDSDSETVERCVAAFTMEITPGVDRDVAVEVYDGDEWIWQEEEFYQEGGPGIAVRFSNMDGEETVEIPIEEDMEAVLTSRGPREIPVQSRLDDPAIETGFYHPAQYVGNEGIVGDRTVFWLLLESPTSEVPQPAGAASFVAHTEMYVYGY
ncbi:hypothetical protein [Natrononativus amylolyticus]|uniref:hypothetical protein n=1 Tax=Natrononativus amylolyticus TaxID=2963434 RepID=UPI0020CDAFE2|nr:hypothetical protein [Natrononativus amylolyticus]